MTEIKSDDLKFSLTLDPIIQELMERIINNLGEVKALYQENCDLFSQVFNKALEIQQQHSGFRQVLVRQGHREATGAPE